MNVVAVYLFAYFLGAIPFGYIVGKMRGIDIRKVGSGNIGATNTYRALGAKAGISVFLLDVAKGVAPPLLAKALLPPDVSPVHMVFVGLVAVLGHSFSPFLKFKGGKGVATGLGGVFGSAPIVGVAGFGTFLVFFALTKYVSLSSILGCLAVIATAILTKQSPAFEWVYIIVSTFVILRHIPNIKRLMNGTEPKFGGTKNDPPKDPQEGQEVDRERDEEGQ